MVMVGVKVMIRVFGFVMVLVKRSVALLLVLVKICKKSVGYYGLREGRSMVRND